MAESCFLRNSSITLGLALLLIVVAPLFAQKDKPPVPIGYTEVPAPKSVQNRPLATREILEMDGPSVLEIEVHDNSGAVSAQASGVVIAPSGVVATNAHVLTGACNLYIKEQSGSLVAASTLLDIDADKDIAILLFPKSFPVAKLGDSRVLQVGDRVVTIGNPLGLEQTVSEGIVSGFRKMGGTRAVIQITAPISPGSSGGGLFNGKGELVGLTTFTLQDSQNLNFAVPLADVMGLLKSGAQELNPDNLVLWKKVTFPNCSGSASSLDSMVIAQQVLGREISDPQFVEILKKLNGGKEATPTHVEVFRGSGEHRFYVFQNYVTIATLNGRCEAVTIYPPFAGLMPLGLSWDESRTEVQRLIGSPSHSTQSLGTSSDFDVKFIIDTYAEFPQYTYEVTYKTGKLDMIVVSR
jgi:trypsin-like peptidase